MDKVLRRKVLSRAVDIAIEISSKDGKTYESSIDKGIEKACGEFGVSVTEFTKSFI